MILYCLDCLKLDEVEWNEMEWNEIPLFVEGLKLDGARAKLRGMDSIPSLITIFLPLLQFGRNDQLALFRPKIFKQWNDNLVPLHNIQI